MQDPDGPIGSFIFLGPTSIREVSVGVVWSSGGIFVRESRVWSLFFLPAVEARTPQVWQPQVDIYRSQQGWIVKMELAGVRPQDVLITARGSQLRISGSRHDWIMEEGWRHYAMEIPYNRFARTIELPCDLAHARITVEGRDGMLLLYIAAQEESDHV
jgi:HSP20 family protein